MCGIAGVYRLGGARDDDAALVAAMNAAQAHRGPDAEGISRVGACVLGHRRLAIIDLSDDGRQPFVSSCGRYHLVFNGEVFNYIELREELEAKGRVFRTKTDTEVLLAAFMEWGRACLDRLNGMFAFAVYDVEKGRLFLARDRFGIKPLYWAKWNGALVFASEIKALLKARGLSRAVHEGALFDYLVFNRTDVGEDTFFAEVKRLPKASWAEWGPDGERRGMWWDPKNFLGRHEDVGFDQAAAAVEELIISAVTLRMRSDVPVGSCLSGGLDSSILVGVVFDRLGAGPGFSAFTAAFPGTAVDETRYVDDMAKRFPFTNHRITPTAETALSELKALVYHNDEPTGGAAIYAQYEVMRLARENGVTVLLDGQGGDEAFAGYQYFHGFWLYGLLRSGKVRAFGSELARVLSRRQDKSALQTLVFLCLPKALRRLALRRQNPFVEREFFDAHMDQSVIAREFFGVGNLGESLAGHYDYKLEHLLRTEDRNSMAFSIESRVPFLDYRLVEYVLGLPDEYKICGGQTKYLQKRAAGRYVTSSILERKDKLGFATPMDAWMASPAWQDLARQSAERAGRDFPGVFDPAGVSFDKADHCWKVIQLALWREIFA